MIHLHLDAILVLICSFINCLYPETSHAECVNFATSPITYQQFLGSQNLGAVNPFPTAIKKSRGTHFCSTGHMSPMRPACKTWQKQIQWWQPKELNLCKPCPKLSNIICMEAKAWVQRCKWKSFGHQTSHALKHISRKCSRHGILRGKRQLKRPSPLEFFKCVPDLKIGKKSGRTLNKAVPGCWSIQFCMPLFFLLHEERTPNCKKYAEKKTQMSIQDLQWFLPMYLGWIGRLNFVSLPPQRRVVLSYGDIREILCQPFQGILTPTKAL